MDLPAPRARIKLQDLSLDAIVLGLLLERVELVIPAVFKRALIEYSKEP
jgi:hypothetical protein